MRVQAKGLAHISPERRPGFMDSFVIAGQRPASRNSTNVLFGIKGIGLEARVPRDDESRFQRS